MIEFLLIGGRLFFFMDFYSFGIGVWLFLWIFIVLVRDFLLFVYLKEKKKFLGLRIVVNFKFDFWYF